MTRGVVLLAVAVAAPALATGTPWTDPPPTIATLELRLPQGADAATVTPLVPIRPGQPLTRSAVRRTLRILYETREYRQVRAHARAVDGGVALTFVLLPRQRVAQVSFLGADALGATRLLRLADIERGEEYRPERVDQAVATVRAAYARIGYRDAKVEVEAREGEGGLVACVFRIDEGPVTRLSGVSFEGRLGLPPPVLRAALGLEDGAPLDLDRVEEALARLRAHYRSAGFLEARVSPATVEAASSGPQARARLVVPVDAGPVVRTRVVGNTLFDDREILDLMALPLDEPVDAAGLEEGSQRIVRRYQLLGHHTARVELRQRAVGPALEELWVRVEEGPRLTVTDIVFPGAQAWPGSRLRAIVCETLDGVISEEPLVVDRSFVDSLGGRRPPQAKEPPVRRRPDPCTVYDARTYVSAGERIEDLYRGRGNLGVEVGAPVLTIHAGGRLGTVALPVSEGVQTRVSEVAFEGVESADPEALRDAVPVRPGDPLSYLAVEEGRFVVASRYSALGRPFALVSEEVAFDGSRARARVVYRVSEGPEVHVGRIIVRGHRNTPASLVRSRLVLRPGDRWDLERVRDSQQAILAMGIYRSAVVRFLEPDQPSPVMDVVVAVSEKAPKVLELGFGISTDDGPRTFVDFTHLAFLASSELQARGKANFPIFASRTGDLVAPGLEWEAHLGLRFPLLFGLRTDAVWERDNRPIYSFTHLSGSVGADAPLAREGLSPSVRAELEFFDLERGRLLAEDDVILSQQDRERLRLEEGQTLLVSVRPGLTLDLRDDPLIPKKGFLVTAALDWSRDLGLGDVDIHFLKAQGGIAWYIPATGSVTLAFSGQAGRVFALSPNNLTIGPKRFFLGGADTLRGFVVDSVLPEDDRVQLRGDVTDCYERFAVPSQCTEDALDVVLGKRITSAGGEAFLLFKSEVRFPIIGSLQGGIFLDVGNLWRDPGRMDVLALRSSAGAGLRYETPVGPLALDVGVNLAPERLLREESFALHFAIGLF